MGVLESSTFTPNGDGVNDVLQIDYVVLKVNEPTAVRVLIHDLAGRLVREVYDGADRAGRYARSWDGLDAGGNGLPRGTTSAGSRSRPISATSGAR